MSHQTGIKASDELREFFAGSKDGRVRVIKVAIENEQLVLDRHSGASGTWEEDYDMMVLPLLEDDHPCYILYRLDVKASGEYQWLFIAYSPDHSPVRQKMLYAATRATLKVEFGAGQIREEMFGTHPKDISLQGFKRHVVSNAGPAPLTMAEEELELVKKSEVRTDVGVDTKHETMRGVSFPISDAALAELSKLQAGTLNYVQLSLDLKAETINLDHADNIDVKQLPSKVPQESARYHFFRFNHTHEGDYLESIVFIYSMPGYKCSIKERMLYSSGKGPLIDQLEQGFKMDIPKKIEIDDAKELTEEFIFDELHPKRDIVRQKFAKPKGPASRGPRRIIKSKPENEAAN